MKTLLIDFFDSFSYNLQDYLAQIGAECVVRRCNDISIEEIEIISPEMIVLSPGPGLPKDYPILQQILERFAGNVPTLGICLGHQAIGTFFGMRLRQSKTPIHGKAFDCFHSGSSIFNNLPSPVSVMRYHSLELSGYSSDIEIIARTRAKSIMAIQHKKLPLLGMQFHPESILSPEGLQMLRNWINMALSWNEKNRKRVLLSD